VDNNAMHAKPDLRVVLKWMIYRSDSVIAAVISLASSRDLQRIANLRPLVEK